MLSMMDGAVDHIRRRLDRESERHLRLSMPFPVRWDPFFRQDMTLADVYGYGSQHFEFHRRQLTLDMSSSAVEESFTTNEFGEAAMPSTESDIHTAVREQYGKAARAAESCCGSTGAADNLIGRSLYDGDDTDVIPEAALAASLGCGNPTLLADLRPGDDVLDLGSGGGIDVLLSARRVGPTGVAYGLDMTPEMLELARKNQAESGIANATFLEGTIEAIPLPDASVDVIISNCVVNLSPNKPAVLRESFRVLRPAGRFAISDIVLRRALPEQISSLMGLWTGCVAGALVDADYRDQLQRVGFVDVEVEPTRVYDRADLVSMAGELVSAGSMPESLDIDSVLTQLEGAVMSAFVRARKP